MKYVLGVYLPGLFLGAASLWYTLSHGLWLYVLLGWVLVSGLGIAVGFHRVYSHKTHDLKPWLDALILFLGTLGGQGSSISWVAVHRGYHHRHSDTEKDLHSPVHGFWHSIIGWYWKLTPDTINHKYAVDLLRKPLHVDVHKHYIYILWAWAGVLTVVSIVKGWPLIQVYLAVLFLSLLQDNLVNSLCHQPKLGYRNFKLKDNSTNFWPLGYFGWGQGWHENHHAKPANFSFKHRWWEFDPCVLFLPLLRIGSRK
jgi:stearoyl-CoA desaturase (delta-9 desaturase)